MDKRTLKACTHSIYRKEFWQQKLNEMGIEYTVETRNLVETWYEFVIQVNLAGKDLNYSKICNALCIPDEMVAFSYRE